jgi:[ribosomal protein S5]-alanine N-acetyltransferase
MAPLHTARLRLIPLEMTHLQALLVNPETVGEMLGLKLVSGLVDPPVDRAIQIKLGKMHGAEPALHAWFTYWLIVLPDQRIGCGLAGFKGAPDAAGEVEIGYGIHPDYQNQGFMTETVLALVGWAFSQPVCRVVTAETHRDNLPSQRVLAKAGFLRTQQGEDMIWWKKANPAG